MQLAGELSESPGAQILCSPISPVLNHKSTNTVFQLMPQRLIMLLKMRLMQAMAKKTLDNRHTMQIVSIGWDRGLYVRSVDQAHGKAKAE